MRQQAIDFGVPRRQQALKHIPQVRLRIQAVDLRRLGQAHDVGRALAAAQGAHDQLVAEPQRPRPDLVLHPVVVDGQLPVAEIAYQRRPAFQAVIDGLGRACAIGQL